MTKTNSLLSEGQARLSDEIRPESCGKGFRIGDTVYMAPVSVGGKYFSFKPEQVRFLYALTKFEGNLEKSCEAVGWAMETAEKFFCTRKWREYREHLVASAVSRDLKSFWWQFMEDGAKGFQETYKGSCDLCHQEYSLAPQAAETYRDDDMRLKFLCRVCQNAVELTYEQKEFKPTREQVQCAVELGARVEPKREHVSHSFSDETYIFETQGG